MKTRTIDGKAYYKLKAGDVLTEGDYGQCWGYEDVFALDDYLGLEIMERDNDVFWRPEEHRHEAKMGSVVDQLKACPQVAACFQHGGKIELSVKVSAALAYKIMKIMKDEE